MKSTAVAHPNLAFVKYWGKRDEGLRLPATGSISMTLGGLWVRSTVAFDDALEADRFRLEGREATGPEAARTSRFVDRIRAEAGIETRVRLESETNFPSRAGLASSAAGFAALALAATRAAGLERSGEELAVLARLGSGSATRSIDGGFVEWEAGSRDDGTDSRGVQLHDEFHWPELRLVAAISTEAPKPCGSSEGMRRSMETSPFYEAWVASAAPDLAATRAAIAGRDLEALGAVSEENALRMHAVCLATRPPIVYWTGGTVDLIRRIQSLRAEGVPAWLSIDAGPNVFAITDAAHQAAVVAALEGLEAVERCLTSGPGPGTRPSDEHLF